MSESVSNNSESYSAPSRKYQGYSTSTSESQESNNNRPASSYSNDSVNLNKNDSIQKARKSLKDSEDFLLKRQEVINNHSLVPLVQNCIRSIAVDYEKELLTNPSVDTVLACYKKNYAKMPQQEKEQRINQVIYEGLQQLANNEKRNNSALKYW